MQGIQENALKRLTIMEQMDILHLDERNDMLLREILDTVRYGKASGFTSLPGSLFLFPVPPQRANPGPVGLYGRLIQAVAPEDEGRRPEAEARA